MRERGKIANIMRIQSLNPRALKAHLKLYLTIMFESSSLPRELRELIAVVVSSANKCEYCIRHHAEALNYYWRNEERIRRLIEDYKSVDLPNRIVKMLDYAVKLTLNPSSVSESDIMELKRCGFSDENILDINLIVSYFNFVNRIALGLGVEFTEEEIKGYKC